MQPRKITIQDAVYVLSRIGAFCKRELKAIRKIERRLSLHDIQSGLEAGKSQAYVNVLRVIRENIKDIGPIIKQGRMRRFFVFAALGLLYLLAFLFPLFHHGWAW